MGTPIVLAAPDKFRGTASAPALADAIVAAARRCGFAGRALPLADGGEGLCAVLGGESRSARVHGPLGELVEARWMLRQDGDAPGATAVIEMAEASGLIGAGGPESNDPEAATTAGTGELIAAAVAAGARRIVVGCGGSATTDGGAGALDALGDLDLTGIELLVATDVTTPFVDAARVFGPQKGADAAAVARLSARLERLAEEYWTRFGVEVRGLEGAGAAGGLAGGLAARGGRIVPGFDLVASLVGLDEAIAQAAVVVTGEGCVDLPSFSGKVVGGVLERVGGRVPVLVVAGRVRSDAIACFPPGVSWCDLVARAGEERAVHEPLTLVGEVVEEFLARSVPGEIA